MLIRRTVPLIAVIVFGAALSAMGQGWNMPTLDPTFGQGGIATRAFDLGQDSRDVGNGVVRVPGSGKIFNVGSADGVDSGDTIIAISGLTSDGFNDPAFGQDGRVILDVEVVSNGVDIGRDISVIPWAPDSAWRLVVAGDVERGTSGDRDFVVALVRPDGSLETAAANGLGWRTVYFDLGDDDTDVAAAVAIDPVGRIVVGGTVDAGPGDTDWGFVRLDPSDLSIDATFGTNGLLVIDLAGEAVLRDIAIQPDGKIVAVGTRDFGDNQMAILRILDDGSVDTTFGLLGWVIIDPDLGNGDTDEAFGVDVAPDGRIIVTGQATQSIDSAQGTYLILCWLLSDGSPDTRFHGTGSNVASGPGWLAWTPPNSCTDYQGRSVRALPSTCADCSHAAVGAVAYCNGNWDYVLAFEEGVVGADGSFMGSLVSAIVDFDLGPVSDDRLTGIAVQPDGKIVGAGRSTGEFDGLDFSAARVDIGEIIFFDGFEASGWWGAEWD